MESTERNVMQILLEKLCTEGLISKNSCERAVELVHSVIALPNFFRYPDVLNHTLSEEEKKNEYSENTQ